MWTSSHLTGGGRYLDCAPSFTPSFETKLRKSREDVGEYGIEMVDLHGIEDENESPCGPNPVSKSLPHGLNPNLVAEYKSGTSFHSLQFSPNALNPFFFCTVPLCML